jgi:hypothetical protein
MAYSKAKLKSSGFVLDHSTPEVFDSQISFQSIGLDSSVLAGFCIS